MGQETQNENLVIQFVTEGSPIPGPQGPRASPTLCSGSGKKTHHPKKAPIAEFSGSYSLIIRNTNLKTGRLGGKKQQLYSTFATSRGNRKNRHFCRGGFGLVQGGQQKIDTTVLCNEKSVEVGVPYVSFGAYQYDLIVKDVFKFQNQKGFQKFAKVKELYGC